MGGLPSSVCCGFGCAEYTLHFQEYLDREFKMCQDNASACGHVHLEFERVVFTDTGTLLLTWTDPTGRIERLRAKFRKQFPGLSL